MVTLSKKLLPLLALIVVQVSVTCVYAAYIDPMPHYGEQDTYFASLGGYGFNPGEPVSVFLDTIPLTVVPTSEINPDGFFRVGFTVPSVPSGYYRLYAQQTDSGIEASAAFNIGGGMQVALDNPIFPRGIIGEYIGFSGFGFTYDGGYSVEVGGVPVGSGTADPYGAISFDSFVVPDILPGEYLVIFTDDSTERKFYLDFLVRASPNLLITPNYGLSGSTVTIQGSNFAEVYGPVALYLSHTFIKNVYLEGSSFLDTFTVPGISEGNYYVSANRLEPIDWGEASAPFYVRAIFVLTSPESGPSGTEVTLTGVGFTPYGSWHATLGALTVASGVVNSDGTILDEFTVPILPIGDYTLLVLDEATDIEISTDFSITESELIKIGVTAPSTDPSWAWPYSLSDIEAVVNLANEDISKYCSDNMYPYVFEFSVLDNQGQASLALENVQSFKSQGINLVAGHSWSTQCQASLSYITSNSMILFSSSSTAIDSLSQQDYLYRLCTNENVHGSIIADLYDKLGIKAAIIYYNDWWYGQELSQRLETELTVRGIEVIESIPYSPETWDKWSDFEHISSLIEASGLNRDEIGLQICTGDASELGEIFEEAYWHSHLQDIKWFSDELTAYSARSLASTHPYLSTRIKLYSTYRAPDYENPDYTLLSERYAILTSHELDFYMAAGYDVLRILAQSVINTGSTEAADISADIETFVQGYEGVSGISSLDLNGDRVSQDYDILCYAWVEGEASFIRCGYYDQGTGEITLLPMDEEPSGLTWNVFPLSGPTGTVVAISGYGFSANGEYDVTLGEVDLFEEAMFANSTGDIRGIFMVPLLSPGTYPLNVLDLETDIKSTYYFEVTGVGVPDGIVSWWPGDGNAYDIIGTNHGEARNGVEYTSGMVDEAFSFDGVDDVVDMYEDVTDDLQQLTIELWVKLNSVPNSIGRFVSLNGEKAILRHDGENNPGQLHFYMSFEPPIGMQGIRVDDVLLSDVFYHVAGTYDGNYMRLYLDGEEVGSLMVSGTPVTGNGVTFSCETETLDGLLDEVCIYNRALTSDEIRLIYETGDKGKSGPTPQFTTHGDYSDPSNPFIIREHEIIPIQSAIYPDLNPPDNIYELVLGKPTAILVNVGNKPVTGFSLSFNGNIITDVTPYGNLYVLDDFTTDGLLPDTTYTFECSYVTSDNTYSLTQDVRFIETSDMSLTISKVARNAKKGDYGFIEDDDYVTMSGYTAALMDATYPSKLINKTDYTPIAGVSTGKNYKGILADIAAALLKAQANANPPGSALAIVIGPNMIERSTSYPSGVIDYFAYHGLPGVAGISFGPAYRGIVTLDGYYWGPAHEIGHVFDLYWGVKEQYMDVTPGYRAYGAWVSEASVIDAYDFMGIGDFENPYSNWVCTSTYVGLLQALKTDLGDPEIILVNGLIYENGTVEQLLPWYSIPEGVPDVLPTGDYSLKFIGEDDSVLGETSFDAEFFMHVDPRRNVPAGTGGFGMVHIGAAPFAFATEYPSGTLKIQVVDNNDPLNPLYTVMASEIRAIAPPVIDPIEISFDPFPVNTPVTARATFSDEAHDTHTAEWDWGDGTGPTIVDLDAGVSVTECTHSYSDPGVYTLTLTLTDELNQASVMEHKYVVVYDPSDGFVTGGGWIMSLPGSYTPDPTLTGKATFGFVSKYVKSSKVPVGNTEFVFHVAGFKLVSTSYEWLVVAGSSAKYKGTGTVNGKGLYGFMLTANDGDLKDGTDTFRIKIWDRASDVVIYDNKMGEPDDSYEGTTLSGGNIVVHKPKK